MYDIKLEDCDPAMAQIIYNASSDRMRHLYGLYGVLLLHWFLPYSMDQIKRRLGGLVDD